MAIEIVAYQPHHVPAVEAFNARLLAGESAYRFPESDVPAWLPPAPGERLYQEIFLAIEGADVRGGYLLKHQDFTIGQRVQSVGAFQLPLSEGAVDPAYSLIGIQLLRHALRRQPLLYALGIGSYEEEAARLLLAARFEIAKVPFAFRAERRPRSSVRSRLRGHRDSAAWASTSPPRRVSAPSRCASCRERGRRCARTSACSNSLRSTPPWMPSGLQARAPSGSPPCAMEAR